jgi:AcrR family transcriptional regulator
VTATTSSSQRRYHHGDLRNALIDAGVELAREGGPAAIVLREAARRVGVSPNAAYRHFADLIDLVDAVARQGLTELATAMQREITKQRLTGDAATDARAYMRATGRAYVDFALTQSGLFRTAFGRQHRLYSKETMGQDWCSPQDLLNEGLLRLVAAGLLPAEEIESARMLAWSTVHGLSLLLMGPMSDVPKRERSALIDATLDQVSRGLESAR